MIELKIIADPSRAIDVIELVEKRLPYAVSDALTDTAFDVRKKAFQAEFRKSFTLRNRFLMKGLRPGAVGPGGVGIQKSKPRVLIARAFTGSGLGFTRLHEEGGRKRKRRHPFAIPDPRSPDLNAKGYVRRRWPGKLKVDQPGSKVFSIGDRIVRRTGRSLTTLFSLRSRVRVKDTLSIRERSEAVARATFPDRFARRWASERRRAGIRG